MKITQFAELVARIEGKKCQVSIAQIMEILNIINRILSGWLYKEIKKLNHIKLKIYE